MKLTTHKVILSLSFVLMIGSNAAFSQTPAEKVNLTKATTEFNSLRYISAIKELNSILKIDTGNVKALEMIAYSYKMVKSYDEALYWYEKLSKQKVIKPEWSLNYAEVLANNQQYERSEGWYRKYLGSVPTDIRAASFSKTDPGQFNKNLGKWKVSFTNLNSLGSDYSPAYYKEGLIFTSNRQTQKISRRIFEWDNTPFSNLYVVPSLKSIKTVDPDSVMGAAQGKNSKLYRFNDDDTAPTSNDTKTIGQFNTSLERDTLGILLEKGLNLSRLKGALNSKFHDGSAAVFPDGSIIFTRNNYYKGRTQQSMDGVNKLKLYTVSGENLNHITEFPYNSNEYSTGHPTLNKTGDILIFASDRPGGYGGSDLYYCVRAGYGQWTRPVNMGKKINTEGNELFPYLNNDVLMFASTGHPGLGGLDLFEIVLKEMKPVGEPKNMGAPINTSKDDFGIIRAEDGKSGFFSSNRKGNDDIYKFSKSTYSITLKGTVTDAKTRIPLPGSRILLHHLDGTDTIRTNAKGEYMKEIPAETDYEATAQKLGYVNNIGFVSSVGITQDSVVRMDIKLNKTETAQQFVISNCDSLKKIFAVQNIYYDLDRSEIRYDARPALDELAALMMKYPEITVITSSHCDSRASEAYNRSLSLRRAESSKTYLISKGISPSRVSVEYYGKTRLLNRCFDGVPCSEADQQLNRRTEFDVILNGVNITRQNCSDK
ncbi:WD40 repeat protein [Pedobacter metabolipauper]|uniref:WD40 repeat protein n=2 Tax=Pedobacter metabolipauper TaxID=425513 RepID=A0A4R6SZW4_9SPHI|nr:WD40 repeat protein [Pedobacter metabolipauper]